MHSQARTARKHECTAGGGCLSAHELLWEEARALCAWVQQGPSLFNSTVVNNIAFPTLAPAPTTSVPSPNSGAALPPTPAPTPAIEAAARMAKAHHPNRPRSAARASTKPRLEVCDGRHSVGGGGSRTLRTGFCGRRGQQECLCTGLANDRLRRGTVCGEGPHFSQFPHTTSAIPPFPCPHTQHSSVGHSSVVTMRHTSHQNAAQRW